MHIVAIHPQERLAIVAPHDLMRAPKFVDDRLRLVHLLAYLLAYLRTRR
jgi:hypothetical protein